MSDSRTEKIPYELIRSKRKTLAIYIKPDGVVEVRAPVHARKSEIDQFVAKKLPWIIKTLTAIENQIKSQKVIAITKKEETTLRRELKAYLQVVCARYAEMMGVTYRSIKVNGARTRWGSCSGRGDLNFTWRLAFAGAEQIEYVAVHELAHRKEMNHSPRFWAAVAEIMPDYAMRRNALREFQKAMVIEVVDQSE